METINIQDKNVSGKIITFAETTTGYLVLVNGVVTWFIRYEWSAGYAPGREFVTYRSKDGGKGFTLIPSDPSRDTQFWGHKSLRCAQRFAVDYEKHTLNNPN